ncbi:murein biosynthesis integral membrane protein MurJ [Jidongwangia harbinensis]|uniref:murein biosynthesis integral membrane protein MurJ n=1 Tax=Jidongwangia harbinensis TaxID=2878561 RepID=UPI001CDA3371|nr:murein biosynthesis integral membrane protein MurJ [Jidongwangia harbinensis]MCA2212720.1 murein biosynthesis integral membrane protein MurJ [Jidongwangia harbinensis]
MTGGLYRSAHAARDGDPPAADDAVLISTDTAVSGAAAAEDQALPPEEPGRSTTGQSAIMAAGSLVSRIVGFVRNALIGMTLGAGIGDAYASALFLPNQIYELLLGGILSSVLIPLLVRRRKASTDNGREYAQKLLTFAVSCLGIAALLVVVAAPVLTAIQSGSGTDQDYRKLITGFAYLMLPIIFFTGVSALIGAVLNVNGHFAAPMWAPILNNIVVIAACCTFIGVFGTAKGLSPADMTPGRIALIGGGTLLGMVVQTAGLLPALRRVGFAWKWRWDPRGLGLGEIGRLAGWMLCFVVVQQLAVFVVVNLLNRVSGGDNAGVLAFNNVTLLMMMAHGIIGVSVMTALLPKMSAAAADGRLADVSADLSRGIRLTATALAPIAVVYGVLAKPVAVTLFQGGAYSAELAHATGGVLLVAAFGLLPLSISYLCTYAFYSLQGTKTVALINLPVTAVRITAYLVLFQVLAESSVAAGMTAGNALSYTLSALISLAVLRRRIGRLNLGSVLAALAKVLAAAAVAAALGLLVVRLLPGGGEPERPEALLQLAVGGLVIMVSYLAAAIVLRVREVHQVIGMIRRKLGR